MGPRFARFRTLPHEQPEIEAGVMNQQPFYECWDVLEGVSVAYRRSHGSVRTLQNFAVAANQAFALSTSVPTSVAVNRPTSILLTTRWRLEMARSQGKKTDAHFVPGGTRGTRD